MDALRTKITHPDGHSFDYSYDTLNRQLTITENTSATTLHSSAYNDQGQMISDTRLTGVESGYGYDPAGRVNTIALALAGTAHDNAFTFTYTPASQIRIRTTSNDLYAHKAHFNIDRSYGVNGLNQYTSVGDYTVLHDDNGNLTSDGGVSFTYDTENRLTGASGAKSAQLIYDPLGRLYETNDGAGGGITRFLYDGDALVAEYDASGAITARYVHGSGVDQPLIWHDGSAVNSTTRRHLFANWQGSITAITDASGNAIAVNAYDSWGIPNPGNIGRFQYTGQIWLPEVGLYHYKARAYSPFFGRFLQTDPVGYEGGFGLYVYAYNDPANLVDPMGNKPGDYFATPTEAGRDAVRTINPESIRRNKEFGGEIRRVVLYGPKEDGGVAKQKVYVATQPREGTGASVEIRVNKDTDVGDYHTHGDYSQSLAHNDPNPDRVPTSLNQADRASWDTANSDNFSAKDTENTTLLAKETSASRAVHGEDYVSVLGTPSGQIKEDTRP